jgi:arsenate reductase
VREALPERADTRQEGALNDVASREPVRVLFLCTQNAARSQIAEALLSRRGRSRFVAASAGTEPAARIHPLTASTLRRAGIDWEQARPRSVGEVLDGPGWDMVITLCDRARETCPTLPAGTVTAHWSIPDPSVADSGEEGTSAFWNVLTMISRRIDLLCALPDEKVRELSAGQTIQESHDAESAKEGMR